MLTPRLGKPRLPTRVAVVDTETAGFPSKARDNSGLLLELGAFAVDLATGMVVGEQLHVLHKPTDWETARHDPAVQKALAVSGTDLAGDVDRWGLPADKVVAVWRRWCAESGVEALASYNVNFERAIMPWVEQPWLRCLMRWSHETIQTRLPAGTCVNKLGRAKLPKQEEAVVHLRQLGVACPEVEGSHRAPYDAYVAAHLLLGLHGLDPNGLRLEEEA